MVRAVNRVVRAMNRVVRAINRVVRVRAINRVFWLSEYLSWFHDVIESF